MNAKYENILKEKLNGKLGKIIFAIGIIGIALIFLSTIFSGEKSTAVSSENDSKTTQYVEALEEKISGIVSEITGAKNVKVMVSLDSGVENVYASENKKDTGQTEDKSKENTLKTEQSDSAEQKYIIVKDKSGNEQPLLVTEIMPSVRGVVVVCEGGENSNVRTAVQSAVVTALDINSKKVCVVGRQN